MSQLSIRAVIGQRDRLETLMPELDWRALNAMSAESEYAIALRVELAEWYADERRMSIDVRAPGGWPARRAPDDTPSLGHTRADHEDCECVEELDHGLSDCQCPGYPQCGATDGAGLDDGPDGRCVLAPGHDTDWHQEWREGRLWAEWRGPHPGKRCNICGKDGREH